MAGWTARALARMVGLPAPTLISWIKSGLVTPESYGRGRGGHMIGVSGLLEVLAIIELRNAGVSKRAIHQAVENLHLLSGKGRPLAQLTLVVDGKDVTWRDAEELSSATVSVLRKPGQRLMILPIGEIHSEFVQQLSNGYRHPDSKEARV